MTLLENLAPGATLIADRSYDTNAIRDLAAERGAWANLPLRIIRKGSFAFSTWVYRQRNLVERFFNQVKQFRGLATRYDRNPENYLAALKLAWRSPASSATTCRISGPQGDMRNMRRTTSAPPARR